MTPQTAFDSFHRDVYNFAYRMTRRTDLADDITQECFLTLVQAPHRYNPARGSMRVYLLSIVRNLALKHYRDCRTEQLDEGVEFLPSIDPRRSIDISHAVAEAVAGLPHLQRESLILFEYVGVSLEEIANIAGADTGTIKSRLHRARERLRKILAAYRTVRSGHGAI